VRPVYMVLAASLWFTLDASSGAFSLENGEAGRSTVAVSMITTVSSHRPAVTVPATTVAAASRVLSGDDFNTPTGREGCLSCDCECEPDEEGDCVIICTSCTCSQCTSGEDCLRTNQCNVVNGSCGTSCQYSGLPCVPHFALLDGTALDRGRDRGILAEAHSDEADVGIGLITEEVAFGTIVRRVCDHAVIARQYSPSAATESRDRTKLIRI
jgi:hypothetical protein